jgi:hypothetical protein
MEGDEMSDLKKVRRELASYHGLLARWGDATNNIPPYNAECRTAWLKQAFREHVDEIIQEKREKENEKESNERGAGTTSKKTMQ